VQYRCNIVKKESKQCPAAISLLYHSDRECVNLYRTEQEHNHADKSISRGMPTNVRDAVVNLYEEGKRNVSASDF